MIPMKALANMLRRLRKPVTPDRDEQHPVGHIECYCGETAPIYADLTVEGEPGEQQMHFSADTSALWLHSFTKHPDAYKEEA